MSKRLLVAVCIAAGMLGGTSAAQANPVGVKGCYGVEFIVCDPVVGVGRIEEGDPTPVCTGTCTNVYLVPKIYLTPIVCYSWKDEGGYQYGEGC
jgi:hypothetical protein